MLSRQECKQKYYELLQDAEGEELNLIRRHLCKNDLYYLLVYECGRSDLDDEWHFDRIREVEAAPDFYLDIWFRESGKSSIITFGMTIKDILNNPEITIAILSYSFKIAKSFLSSIKQEFEKENGLKDLFPDIFWNKPNVESSRWSVNEGITVKRKTTRKEATIETFGLTDGGPTGKHFDILVYDDVVEQRSVSSVDMISKISKAWELSLNAGLEGGKVRYIGTRYSWSDTYATMIDREVATPRIYPATDNGKANGKSVLFNQEYLDLKKQSMGSYVFACQMLLDPVPPGSETFKKEWLQYYSVKTDGFMHLNRIIIADPANSKKKYSDWTAIIVVGLGRDGNYYIIDIVRDKYNLTERANVLVELHQKYKPNMVYYEQYGMVSDIHYIQEEQKRNRYRFPIVGIKGNVAKVDRIKNLIPTCENQRLYLPYEGEINHRDYEGKVYDPVKYFVDNEYLSFPFGSYDDVLDAISRIADSQVKIKRPGGVIKKTYVMSDYSVLGE